MPGKVVHFEIPADNVERAKLFYEKAFGWQISKYPGGLPRRDELCAQPGGTLNQKARLVRGIPSEGNTAISTP